jgi:hypothetical protein
VDAADQLVGDKKASTAVGSLLLRRVPKFFYFTNYHILPGRVDLQQLGYGIFGGEIETLAANASRGISASQNLRNALWLNGRANRTAADFYMIYEYAEREFGGRKGIRDALGLSDKSQSRLTSSANNVSPLEGGRHAKGVEVAVMRLDEQREYVSELLRLWITKYQ